VSRSKTLALIWLNRTGKKLLVVSNRRDAKAGKEKLVGERENITGTAFANGPVALTRGFPGIRVNAGILGIVNPKINAIAQHTPKTKKIKTLRVK